MDTDKEIRSLAAETLAFNIILSHLLSELAKDPKLRTAIRTAFNKSADIAEHTAIVLGKDASPLHTVKAMQIIEEMRAVVLGRDDKPGKGIV